MPGPTPADREPNRTDAQARKRYLHWLQQSLSAVHPRAQWVTVPSGPYLSAVTNPDTLRFRTADGPLYLRATQRFTYGPNEAYHGERKVVTCDYVYTLSRDADLRIELYSWQWHPGTHDEPHVHVGRGRPTMGSLGKLHLPTGRVALEQVLLFMIRDHGIEVPDRDRALVLLAESLRRFTAYRTWS